MRLMNLTEIALLLTAAGGLVQALPSTAVAPPKRTDGFLNPCQGAVARPLAQRRIHIPGCGLWSAP